MAKTRTAALFATAATLAAILPAHAHFQMLYPGSSARMPGAGDLDLTVVFTHPFAGGPTMEMGTPEQFFMMRQRGEDAEAEKVDLSSYLTPMHFTGSDDLAAAAFTAKIPGREVRSLGDYILVLAPSPFYEASEDKYIQQFTKTIVNVGGVPGAWDQPVGDLPAEIRPLDKPYANWEGGVFRGVVLANGEPVPFAEIEVEYVNHDFNAAHDGWAGEAHVEAPHPSLEAMSIRADANGNFTVGLPKEGWWGIGALDVNAGTEYEGKPLSQDAVIWVEVTDID